VGVLAWAIGLMDGLFHGILGTMQHVLPTSAENFLALLVGVPGMGVVLIGLLLLITGMLVTNMVGAWWLAQWNKLLSHIPIVKSIYVSVKQVSDTLFSTNGNAFREAVLVQYPHPGSWTIAFVTGKPSGEVAGALPGEHVSLYVPTTPNPTSGFFLLMPRAACRPLSMSVDEALKYIISMGVVAPPAGILVPPEGADPNRLG
jgi:uncharacterized membrane protein